MHIWLGLTASSSLLVCDINIMSLAKVITESQAQSHRMSFGSSFLLPPATVTKQAN